MTLTLKNIIIFILIILILFVANDNWKLQKQNQRLIKNIKKIIYTKNNRCLGYIEPKKIIKDMYVKKLIK